MVHAVSQQALIELSTPGTILRYVPSNHTRGHFWQLWVDGTYQRDYEGQKPIDQVKADLGLRNGYWRMQCDKDDPMNTARYTWVQL